MTEQTKKNPLHEHAGHRQRLKSKLLSAQFDHLYPHELLELLTFYSIPRKDTNDLAHQILSYYNDNFSAVFEAGPKELMKIDGVGENTAALFALVSSIIREIEKEKVSNKRELNSLEDIVDYVTSLFSGHQQEVFYAVFLNRFNKIIAYEKIFEGSTGEVAIYPRNIVEAALKYKATSQVILAHNHPSGNMTPSGADLDTTRLITRALNTVDIRVKDHIIVAGHRYYSFAENEVLY